MIIVGSYPGCVRKMFLIPIFRAGLFLIQNSYLDTGISLLIGSIPAESPPVFYPLDGHSGSRNWMGLRTWAACP